MKSSMGHSDISIEAIEGALAHVGDAEWTEGRLQQTRRGVERKRRAQQVRRVAGGTVLAAAAALALAWVGPWGPGGQEVSGGHLAVAGTDDAALGEALTFADGSRVTPLSPGTRMHVQDVSDGRIEVGLDGGSARFEVTPGQERQFVVEAGDLTVVVLGTVFVVDRTSEAGTRVEVERGVVRVEWANGEQILRRGQVGAFPPEMLAEASAPTRRRARHRPPRWRSLASDGDYDRAFAALEDVTGAEDLWLAADVARRSGHPEEAVPYLERLLERYPNGRRSQNAAFTLGRVLTDIGRGGEAASAFQRAQRGGGRLGESALYREAKALENAGRTAEARARAERYRAQYPEGRYTDSLQGL